MIEKEVKQILDSIGHGKCILRQHKLTLELDLVRWVYEISGVFNRRIDTEGMIKISYDAFIDVKKWLHQLTIDGEPPQEQRVTDKGYRMGCKELGLDYDNYDWWVLCQ